MTTKTKTRPKRVTRPAAKAKAKPRPKRPAVKPAAKPAVRKPAPRRQAPPAARPVAAAADTGTPAEQSAKGVKGVKGVKGGNGAKGSPLTLAAVKAKEQQLAELLRRTRTVTRGKDPKGGGWNRKSVEEHRLEGTYRADRHGKLQPGIMDLKPPPGKVTASAASQSQWITGPGDEAAVRNGCRFNEALADYACDFFPRFLRHFMGEWAGNPFELNTFQRDKLVRPLFGWVRADGTRRFRRTYIELPKKNYKSTTAAGIGLFMLVADGEAGAEIYSLGGDKDQARIVHRAAVQMVEASPDLAAVLKINHTNGNIAYAATNSFYRVLSATPRGKHGLNAHCAIADELHEWYGDELWHSVQYAFRARRQPLAFVITNAGNDMQSVCYRQRENALAILSGAVTDDEFFALICGATREEAEAEVAEVKAGSNELPIAARCNPAFGDVVKPQTLLSDIRAAIHTPSDLPNLLRLTYGVWDTAVSPWLDGQDWERCAADFTVDSLAGQTCHAGLDLSKTGDMTALALVFPDPGDPDVFRQIVRFWLPEHTVEERKHVVDYRAWQQAGWLTIIPGAVIDHAAIQEEISRVMKTYSVASLSYDAMYATTIAQWIEQKWPYVERVEFPQTIMRYAGPTSDYERLVMAGKLLHNRNALLTWQAGHCQVKCDLNRNKRPVKPAHGDIRSIDGIVAGIMALARATAGSVKSAYEDPGREVLFL